MVACFVRSDVAICCAVGLLCEALVKHSFVGMEFFQAEWQSLIVKNTHHALPLDMS